MPQLPQRHWRMALIVTLLFTIGWLGCQPAVHALSPLGQTVPPAPVPEPESRYTGRLIVQLDPALVGNDTSAERLSRLQRALKSNIAAFTPMNAMPGWAIVDLARPVAAASSARVVASPERINSSS